MQATPEHLIGHGKGVGERGRLVSHAEQVLVGNDQEGVHLLEEFRDARFGEAHAALALEREWLGNNPDGENAMLARYSGYDGRCPGACTAAHAGGNEHHVCTGQMIADRIACLIGRRAPHFGLRASAKATGHLGAHLDDALGPRHGERLRVGICDDKFHALQPGHDHVVDGIAARAADPKHNNAGLHLANIGDIGHFYLIFPKTGNERTLIAIQRSFGLLPLSPRLDAQVDVQPVRGR